MSFLNVKILLISLVVFNFMAASVHFPLAAEQFKYDSKDRRDPFVPLVTKEGRITASLITVYSLKDIVLEGIVWDSKGGSIAIINQDILRENDYVGDYQIDRIESDRVVLKKGDKEFVINLRKEGE